MQEDNVKMLLESTKELLQMLPPDDIMEFVSYCSEISEIWCEIPEEDAETASFERELDSQIKQQALLKTLRLITLLADQYGTVFLKIKNRFSDRYDKLCDECNN